MRDGAGTYYLKGIGVRLHGLYQALGRVSIGLESAPTPHLPALFLDASAIMYSAEPRIEQEVT